MTAFKSLLTDNPESSFEDMLLTEHQTDLMTQREQMQLQMYHELQKMYQTTCEAAHDINRHVSALKKWISDKSDNKAEKYLSDAKYLEQTTELTAKINKLQSELKKLTRSDDEDETLEQLEMIIDFFEKQNDSITEFNESAFEFLIEKIVVVNQNELEFHMIGGLKFTEKCSEHIEIRGN